MDRFEALDRTETGGLTEQSAVCLNGRGASQVGISYSSGESSRHILLSPVQFVCLNVLINILGGESGCPRDSQTVPAAKLINHTRVRQSIETVPTCVEMIM